MGIATETSEEMVQSEDKRPGWFFTLPADAVQAEEPERHEQEQAFDVREDSIWADLDVRISLV